MLAALVALVVADVLLVTGGGFWQAVSEVFATPTTALLIYVLLICSAVVHEMGHAAACRYGGADPGEIGVGVYLVFPAFYTDVTDSYRLGRAGRVRTDLGGLHFNVLTVLALVAGHQATGSGLLLLTALALQLQMLQQLIPVVRFDGYFILSDLAGVPDLFSRVGPGAAQPAARSAARPAGQRAAAAGAALRHRVGADGRATAGRRGGVVRVGHAAVRRPRQGGDPRCSSWCSTSRGNDATGRRWRWRSCRSPSCSCRWSASPSWLWRLATTLATLVRRRLRIQAAARLRTEERRMDTFDQPPVAEPPVLSAADFTDAVMYAPRVPPPRQGWRRAVYQGSGHAVNPGPSPTEQRRQELERRLRTPIDGIAAGGGAEPQGRRRQDHDHPRAGQHVRDAPR